MAETTKIGSRLRAARARRGWNRETLAFYSGISWSAIAQIESGRRRNVRPSTLAALSDSLGVSLDYLVRGTASDPMLEHRALIYERDETLLDVAGRYLEEGLGAGDSVLAVLSKPKIALLRKRLGPAAKPIRFVDSSRWLKTPEGAIDGFREFRDRSLKSGVPWARVLGEPIWEGRSSSEVEQWIRFESLLNLVFAASPISMLCPYDARTLAPKILRAAHVTHPQTVGEAGNLSSEDYAEPEGFMLDPGKAGPR